MALPVTRILPLQSPLISYFMLRRGSPGSGANPEPSANGGVTSGNETLKSLRAHPGSIPLFSALCHATLPTAPLAPQVGIAVAPVNNLPQMFALPTLTVEFRIPVVHAISPLSPAFLRS